MTSFGFSDVAVVLVTVDFAAAAAVVAPADPNTGLADQDGESDVRLADSDPSTGDSARSSMPHRLGIPQTVV